MVQKAIALPAAPLPFTAIVGLDTARQALLLLAVDPSLAGVAIGAGAGTGKSALVRAFARMLAGGREFDPTIPWQLVEMPVGVSEDRLLGGIDIEATLATGERVHRSGLLARANGGMLYVDSVNLLDDSTINHILSALDSGVVRVEREGISVVEPARFVLLVTYDPAEGPPRRHLLDRLGLIVAPIGKAPVTTRAEVVRRNLQPGTDYEDDEALVLAGILAARELLPSVTISDEQVQQLSLTAMALGIEGHRADLFAVRAARAAAALAGREEVNNDDLELAVRLVMLPRATRLPEMTPEEAGPPPPPEPAPPPPSPENSDDEQRDDEEEKPPQPPEDELTIEELILAAMETDVPPDILETPFTVRRRGRSGSRGTISGQRGRHIRSVPGKPAQGRLDVIATLRAAAPWQRIRAAEYHPHRRGRIHLRADDLHIKKYRSKAGTLFCFLVDASGSMALHRMRQAKGAVNALLQQAYVHRDQVALLAFRGERADLLLPPSQSVELAKRALDVLPTGGGTPLAAALLAAYQISEQARSRGIFRTTIVLITDGRPNVPLKADPTMDKARRLEQARQEVQQLAGRLRAAGVGAVVIDTQRSFVSRGEAQQLAAWLGGRYVYLPNGRGDQIANAVIAASEEG
ncbi:MAG TPA: magnesium chelatase ATPase subunit D [Chloroflexus aurantiacus]|jgi:magnesium chelatase subunit D|uniref:Mg-protoporphyrin IX chelatase n=1 Tax=Chloroflexus aurantiacus (strain ATCC 29366 / DSM 635 / J-10-fl) TaxID=324602 RepID=A9WDR4_CHLAA|nr:MULTISPECIES: magnesium chelatase ATPase subunit D [Chloroflexus]ABY33670.1 magnesium chelatase ATPase subunit D [Chloroflexus aurantiacus J-10-fl]RMG47102.1 MAG: magnesium chelatase ATPase subunit D [Chloroflexota bacterium]GIV94296.1 MAG: Mg-protoporphyrin IX chelatase [Chloroflexus sp.]HBW68113.1 magnesium chelatase ATPase subunit D [Chloroflexus aurantiacus]